MSEKNDTESKIDLEVESAYNTGTIPFNDPNKKFAILTCMDPRMVPDVLNNLSNIYIIRNAGGRASDDAIRSLIISYKLLHTNEWFVIHHTDCGMEKFNNKVMGCLLEHSLEPAILVKNCNVTLEPQQSVCKCSWKDVGKCPGSSVGRCIDWLPILDGLFNSVYEDVLSIRNHPLVPSNIRIHGYIFDLTTSKLIPVPRANKVGRAKPIVCCEIPGCHQKEKFCLCKENKC